MEDILLEQIAYYRARAAEYDEWFYRQGRYDHGPELNQQWASEVEVVRQALHRLGPVNDVLELACGTGIWTQELLKTGQRITALDASPEVIKINRVKLQSDRVHYEQVDLFTWEPQQQYDLVFFGFWLSHVPPEKLEAFLQKVAKALRPGGHLFLVDSQRTPSSTARDHTPYEEQNIHHVRKLNDGREFTIVKVFYTPDELTGKLRALDIAPDVRLTENYFIYGGGVKNR